MEKRKNIIVKQVCNECGVTLKPGDLIIDDSNYPYEEVEGYVCSNCGHIEGK